MIQLIMCHLWSVNRQHGIIFATYIGIYDINRIRRDCYNLTLDTLFVGMYITNIGNMANYIHISETSRSFTIYSNTGNAHVFV